MKLRAVSVLLLIVASPVLRAAETAPADPVREANRAWLAGLPAAPKPELTRHGLVAEELRRWRPRGANQGVAVDAHHFYGIGNYVVGKYDKITGARVPTDRPIDSIDQSDFLLGKTEKSAREGFPIFCAERLQAVKWRNWKLHFMRQDTMFDPPVKNPVPIIYNLFTDPREEKPSVDSWVVGPILKIVGEFENSVKKYPIIPMGTPDPYTPS
jgi:arylsulfatase